MTTVIAALSIAGGVAGTAGAASGFDLQGHRGARGLMPENTLPAFAKALSIGVSTLELDVAVTKDGQVVVIHNPHLEPEIARSSDGRWLTESGPSIHSITLETLKSFDVGRLNPTTRYAAQFPDQTAIDGATVPTLGDVFDLVMRSGNQDVRFNIETKLNPDHPDQSLPPKDFARAVLNVVHAFKMDNRVAIQSFDWRTLQEVQRMAPGMTTSYLTANQSWLNNMQVGTPGPSPWMSGFDVDLYDGSAPHAIKAAGGAIWSSYHREVDATSIKAAHDLGLLVKVWTVNTANRMEELIDLGVDGIITDYPNILRDVLINRNIPVPAATPVTP